MIITLSLAKKMRGLSVTIFVQIQNENVIINEAIKKRILLWKKKTANTPGRLFSLQSYQKILT